MELIDVNTQDFQYLTLSQYNGEKKYVRARCELRKDEPFISDTNNAFVCVESFRLSCAPNEKGIIYRMLPNTYAIQVEMETDQKETEPAPLAKCFVTDFLLDGKVTPDKRMSFVPNNDNFDNPTVSSNEIIEAMMEDLNPTAVTTGTVLTVDPGMINSM